MSYNPVLHHRRSIRLPGYDYTQAGAYYITICTHRRECLFGDVIDGRMCLSRLGKVVAARWKAIPRTFRHVELDEWVVMPDHVHGVIWIVDHGDDVSAVSVDAASAVDAPLPRTDDGRPRGAAPGSVGAIVGNVKSVGSRRINRIRRAPGTRVWQRGYWEHIVHSERDLEQIRAYIRANPARWERDRSGRRRHAKETFERRLGLRLRYVQGE
jgi:putative transposase